jgi:undecaprenyl-diphosphatase
MVALGVMWWLVGDGHGHAIDTFGFDAFGSHDGTELATLAHPLAVTVSWLADLCGLIVVALLAKERRWADAAAIVGGALLVDLTSLIAKDIEQRPRPAQPLTAASGYSFPSTTSALSITAIAVAIAYAHGAAGHPERGRLAIAAGVTLSAGTGVLMVAIRVHYLTDVIAGWALGVLVFAAWTLLVRRIQRSLVA